MYFIHDLFMLHPDENKMKNKNRNVPIFVRLNSGCESIRVAYPSEGDP